MLTCPSVAWKHTQSLLAAANKPRQILFEKPGPLPRFFVFTPQKLIQSFHHFVFLEKADYTVDTRKACQKVFISFILLPEASVIMQKQQ